MVVVPILILGVAGWLAVDQRRAATADGATIEQYLHDLVDAAGNDTFPSSLTLSDPTMHDVLRREFSELAAVSYAITVDRAESARPRCYVATCTVADDPAAGVTVIVEMTDAWIMIVGYRLPHVTDDSLSETDAS